MTAELLGWFGALNFLIHALGVWVGELRLLGGLLLASVKSRSYSVPKRFSMHGERGFTLTEIMVALSIVGVASAAATPSIMVMAETQKVKTATFNIYSALVDARGEAVLRNTVVTITPRGGNFANGYELSANGVVLKSQPGTTGVIVNAPDDMVLAFNRTGRLTTSAEYQLELVSAQDRNLPKRCLVVGTSGRPAIYVDNDRDGNCLNG